MIPNYDLDAKTHGIVETILQLSMIFMSLFSFTIFIIFLIYKFKFLLLSSVIFTILFIFTKQFYFSISNYILLIGILMLYVRIIRELNNYVI